VKQECLSKLILFGEGSLRRAVTEFIEHFHAERNHQGKGNVLLFPVEKVGQQRPRSRVRCDERIGGLLRTAMPHKYFDHARCAYAISAVAVIRGFRRGPEPLRRQ
jgi:hypothetical protein